MKKLFISMLRPIGQVVTILCFVVAIVIAIIVVDVDADSSNYVSSQFKAPTIDTPHDIVEQWKTEDEELWKYVEEVVPAVLDHTGSEAFDSHLKGVQAVLRYWKAPKYLTDAGLFHSIYGTEGFQGFSLPLKERRSIIELIGERSEKLCFWFCMIDRSTLDQTVFDYWDALQLADDGPSNNIFQLRARPELGRFDIIMTKDEWIDFIELSLADWLEQVEGAATKPVDRFLWKVGEAYTHRRLAFHKMSQILSIERKERLGTITQTMYDAVFATESPSTKHLIQVRTPPMSDASAEALDALRAIGEDIPIDLSPQPMSENNDNENVMEGKECLSNKEDSTV